MIPVIFAILTLLTKNMLNKTSPLFLIPGDGGSKLYAKLNGSHSGHYICKSDTNYYFLLWASPYAFFPVVDYCYHYNLRLGWLNSKPVNQTGVQVITGPFGDPNSVQYIDGYIAFSKFTGYFSAIIAHLTSPLSPLPYRSKKNLFGVPFDFRLGLNDFGDIFTQFKDLVEKSFESSGRVPVTLLAHSYGCILTAQFLENQSLEWRGKYIRRFVSISGPYGGSIQSLKGILTGINLHVHLNVDSLFRDTLRTFPSTFLLFPTIGTPIQVGDIRYTHTDYEMIIKKIGRANDTAMVDMLRLNGGVLPQLRIPEDVDLNCIYSRGIKTVERFKYPSWNMFPNDPSVDYCDGDEIVGLESLEECGKRHPWATVKVFDKLVHSETLNDPQVLKYIDSILLK